MKLTTKTDWLKLLVAPLFAIAFTSVIVGCEGDDTMENAGEDLDETGENIERGVDDMADDTGNALENAGDEMENELED